MKNWLKNIGPGPLIAAAFIGPGTVTVCTLAGVEFGYELLWAMLLSIVATVVLQTMAVRLGIVTQIGLSEHIRKSISHPVGKVLAILLILSAIVIGNSAYEGGNISGGVLGLETIFGVQNIELFGLKANVFSLLIGLLAFILLYIGNYKVLERSLITMVVLMSITFIITAFMTQPPLGALLKGLLIPKIPENGFMRIISLVGTTVVPYNLFLHASLVKEKWKDKEDLPVAKKDTLIAVILGGIVSMAIIVSAAAVNLETVTNASDLAKGLAPLFGDNATYFLSIGLFAAGITSAITAPLAAAYVVKGCLGWNVGLKSNKFRAVWIIILVLGVLLSSSGIKPIVVIQFAQIANGILLPIIAGFLLWIMNNNMILGNYKNSRLQNIIGILIVLITVFLGIKSILKVMGVL